MFAQRAVLPCRKRFFLESYSVSKKSNVTEDSEAEDGEADDDDDDQRVVVVIVVIRNRKWGGRRPGRRRRRTRRRRLPGQAVEAFPSGLASAIEIEQFFFDFHRFLL